MKKLEAFRLLKADSGNVHTALYLLRVNENSSKEEMLHALHEVKFPSYYRHLSRPEPTMRIGEKKGINRKEVLKLQHDKWFEEHKNLSACELWKSIQSELNEIDWWSDGKKPPNYSFWLRMDTWTKEQALLLMFGLEPKRVSLEFIGGYVGAGVDKAISIYEWYEIVTNSITSRKIGAISSVDDWINWFDSKGFEIPKELICGNAKAVENNQKKEVAKGKAEKQIRVTLWHIVVENFLSEGWDNGDKTRPTLQTLMDYLEALSLEGHPVIEEYLSEEQAFCIKNKTKPIVKGTIENVLIKKWNKITGNAT